MPHPSFRAIFSTPSSEISRHFPRAVKKKSARGFVLLAAPLETPTPYQRFVVVPTKKFGNAVTRNKVKRLIKHVLWEQGFWNRESSEIFLLLCYRPVEVYSYEEALSQIQYLLGKPFTPSAR